MFGHKNKQPEYNEYDTTFFSLRDKLAEAGWNMDDRIDKVYIRNTALLLYKEKSPDWEKAREDYEAAQYGLLCSIGVYDDKYTRIMNFLEEHGKDLTINYVVPPDSHQWIESHLKNLLLP